MGLFSKNPNTISDKDWRRLQDRARKANPDLGSLTGRRAIERRKAAAEQRSKRKAS